LYWPLCYKNDEKNKNNQYKTIKTRKDTSNFTQSEALGPVSVGLGPTSGNTEIKKKVGCV
jgi:hypothetical protein